MEFLHNPDPFQNDELSKEDRAIIKDAARNIACMNGISCKDAEYSIHQALKGMSECNLLQPYDLRQEVRDNG